MNGRLPSHLATVSASIGDKPDFGDKRHEKRPILLGFGRGGGDRKDKQSNKACALNALQPPPLSNWNKRNRRQVPLPWAHTTRLQQLRPSLLTINVSNKSGTLLFAQS